LKAGSVVLLPLPLPPGRKLLRYLVPLLSPNLDHTFLFLNCNKYVGTNVLSCIFFCFISSPLLPRHDCLPLFYPPPFARQQPYALLSFPLIKTPTLPQSSPSFHLTIRYLNSELPSPFSSSLATTCHAHCAFGATPFRCLCDRSHRFAYNHPPSPPLSPKFSPPKVMMDPFMVFLFFFNTQKPVRDFFPYFRFADNHAFPFPRDRLFVGTILFFCSVREGSI